MASSAESARLSKQDRACEAVEAAAAFFCDEDFEIAALQTDSSAFG